MDFQPKDFDKLKFNCYLIPKDKDLIESFPELSRYSEFKEPQHGLDNNCVIRYVIYCYDKFSPLVSERNLIKRKVVACKLSGFDIKDGKFSVEVENMMSGKNIFVNRMICAYIRNQQDARYALLVATISHFYDNLTQLSEPGDALDMNQLTKKAQLQKHTTEMISMLDQTAEETFNGDIQLIYTLDEINQEEQEKIQSYPEFIASQRENGELEKTFAKMKKTGQVL